MVAYSRLQRKTSVEIRQDSLGGLHHEDHHTKHNFDSLTYVHDGSDVYRAFVSQEHYAHRGKFWNAGKHATIRRYILIATTAALQATVAYWANLLSKVTIESKFANSNRLLREGHVLYAFVFFVGVQLAFASIAAVCVYIEPVSAGSGIPEVKCYLNGMNLPRVGHVKTLACKVIGVVCSVCAGLPVGKEGPMVHSGAVIAASLSRAFQSNDAQTRDLVACGAAAGVCTAFSAPIGGVLFALEEGASYWGPSQTWRTFFCSMIAFTTLLLMNTVGSQFGKVGFNKLFSFGNFEFEGNETAYHVHELFYFVLIGMFGGFIGAIFNDTNEKLTHWRIRHINSSKNRRLAEALALSIVVSLLTFLLPLLCGRCRPLPNSERFKPGQQVLVKELVPFRCEPGKEYNELASLFFTESGVAIRQLFHLHKHAFSGFSLVLFFGCYISMAVSVYGMAVPSGLFVPSLLSGAAFGRLVGNVAHKLHPGLALSNTYALIGAAAVLGGMARMTISLTVILLECTGNEQFVLPLMLALMTARIFGEMFNSDLYHIHIHLKKGVEFLEAELRSVTRHHNLTSHDVMSDKVIFIRPVEQVGTIYDILRASTHSNYVVVDVTDSNVLYGTIGRDILLTLLRHREFGLPAEDFGTKQHAQCLEVQGDGAKYFPLLPWDLIAKCKEPFVRDLRISEQDRGFLVDVRPYSNTAPITVHEYSSIQRTYDLFRSLGLRFLPVTNRYNQVVGIITRSDLTPDALAEAMLTKGKKHH